MPRCHINRGSCELLTVSYSLYTSSPIFSYKTLAYLFQPNQENLHVKWLDKQNHLLQQQITCNSLSGLVNFPPSATIIFSLCSFLSPTLVERFLPSYKSCTLMHLLCCSEFSVWLSYLLITWFFQRLQLDAFVETYNLKKRCFNPTHIFCINYTFAELRMKRQCR